MGEVTSLRSNKLNELLLKRDELLKQQPGLQRIQDEIEVALHKAGNQHNRCIVINKMLKESTLQLSTGLQDLISEILRLNDNQNRL